MASPASALEMQAQASSSSSAAQQASVSAALSSPAVDVAVKLDQTHSHEPQEYPLYTHAASVAEGSSMAQQQPLDAALADNAAPPLVVSAEPHGYTSPAAISARTAKLRTRMIGINVPVHASIDVAHRHGARGKKGTAAAAGELRADGLSATDQDITLRQVQDKLQIISTQAGTSAVYVGATSFAVIDARGGDAGSGGKAGDGGSVTLTVVETDLALLVLAEPDTAGGKAANRSKTSSAVSSGGRDGRVTYRIVNAAGDEVASASDRFNASIVSYDVCDENEDGIFERGEHFTVRNVKIVNTGGLPLPAGATLSFPDLPYPHAPTVKWIDADPYTLPAIGVGETFILTAAQRVFRFFIPLDLPPGTPASTAPRIKLLGRSAFPESELPLSIPLDTPDHRLVQFSSIKVPERCGPGEKITLQLRVNNNSSRAVGSRFGREIKVKLRLHKLFSIIPSADGSYEVLEDGSAVASLQCIPPRSSVLVSFTVVLSMAAATSNYFSNLAWELLLIVEARDGIGGGGDGGAVSERTSEVREGSFLVSPAFLPAVKTDVVCFIHLGLLGEKEGDEYERRREFDERRREFHAWNYIFSLCGLSVNWWDISRYGSLCPPPPIDDQGFPAPRWEGTDRLIVFLTHPPHAPVEMLSFPQVIAHYASHPQAGMLVWGATEDQVDRLTFDFNRPVRGRLGAPNADARPMYRQWMQRPGDNSSSSAASAASGSSSSVVGGAAPARVTPMDLDLDLTPAERDGLFSFYSSRPPADAAAPFTHFKCCGSWVSYQFWELKWTQEHERDKYRAATVALELEGCGDGSSNSDIAGCSTMRGELGIFRAILPRSGRFSYLHLDAVRAATDRLPAYIPRPPVWQEKDLPFRFEQEEMQQEYKCAKAKGGGQSTFRDLGQPFSAPFTEAIVAVLMHLSPVRLMAMQLDAAPVSNRMFATVAANAQQALEPVRASFATVLEHAILLQLRDGLSFDTAGRGLLTRPLITELLSLRPHARESEDAHMANRAVVRAFLRTESLELQRSSWFARLCGSGGKASFIAARLHDYLSPATPDARRRLLSECEPLFRGVTSQEKAWPPQVNFSSRMRFPLRSNHQSVLRNAEKQRLIAREQSEAWSCARREHQLAEFQAVQMKQRSSDDGGADQHEIVAANAMAFSAHVYAYTLGLNDEPPLASAPARSFVSLEPLPYRSEFVVESGKLDGVPGAADQAERKQDG